MWECYVLNNTGVLFPVNDLNIRLQAGEMRKLSATHSLDKIKSSIDLYNAVASQSIIINNGSKNLNPNKGLRFISY